MRSCIGSTSVTEQARPQPGAAASLQAIWYARSPPPWGLRLLSHLFGGVVALRSVAHRLRILRSQAALVPVIVVGNLAVGGTGKTPLVIWLAEQLRLRGRRPGIVLRGYGGRATRDSPQLLTDDSDPIDVGDEAVLLRLRTRLPVVAGRDRTQAVQRLLRESVDIIVSDDGLQHLRLARDFEIVVIDGARGLGNGYLLPAGPLREPASRLQRVDCLVVNGDRAPGLELAETSPVLNMRVSGDTLQPLSGQGASLPLADLAGRRVHAVAGIGNPGRFFRQLTAAGVLVTEHPFPDHHRYRAADIAFNDGLPVLMTEKDAVKCRAFAAADCWYLPVAASFAAEQAAELLELLAPLLMR
jgi:tetraacyldisaccharide 4'-kinase